MANFVIIINEGKRELIFKEPVNPRHDYISTGVTEQCDTRILYARMLRKIWHHRCS